MATLWEQAKLLRGLTTGERAGVGPFYVTVDVTNRCNLSCLGCEFHSPHKDTPLRPLPSETDLDAGMFGGLCRELQAMGTRALTLTGDGEPLLHPRAGEFVAAARRAGMTVTLFTNGTLLDDRRVRELMESGLDILRVSIWASSREEYEKNYPGTNAEWFGKVLEGVRRVSAAKAARNSRLPRLTLHMPINRFNFRSTEAFVDLARETGCDAVSFAPMRRVHRRSGDFSLSPQEEAEACAGLLAAARRADTLRLGNNIPQAVFRYAEGERRRVKTPCYIAWLHARVKVDGAVLACNPCKRELGHLKHDSFREIWNGSAYRDFRRTGLQPGGLPSAGDLCDHHYCCHLLDNLRVHRFYRWVLPLFRPRVESRAEERVNL